MFLIRVSSGFSLGKGHINRCKRVRKSIKSKVVWFVDKGTKNFFFKHSKDKIYEEASIYSIIKLEKYIKKNKIKGLLIDMFSLQRDKIDKIALINPTILIVDGNYQSKNTLNLCFHPIASNKNNFISGFKYFPLMMQKQYIKKSDLTKNILVSFGNIDSSGLTEKIIIVLKNIFLDKALDSKIFKVNVVIGSYKKNRKLIEGLVSNNKNFKLHYNLTSLKNLYKNTYFAIGSPGFSQIERIEYGIPSVLISQNKLHKVLLKYWNESNCALVAKNLNLDLTSKILYLLNSKKNRDKIKNNISKSFDDKGGARTIKKIESFCLEFRKSIN